VVESAASHPVLGLTYAQVVPLNPDRGGLRLVRGALLGAVAAAIGVGLHVSAHGVIPRPALVVTGVVAAGLVGTASCGRRLTFSRALLVLLLLQPVLHFVLVAGGHQAHSAAATEQATSAGSLMVAAHVAAAVVAALWVSVGDAVLWRWIGEIWLQLSALVVLVVTTPAPRVPRSRTAAPRRALDLLLRGIPYRGPPITTGRRYLSC
jgi:hypothetical protein